MTPSATAISTLFEKQQRQQEVRTEVVPLDIDGQGMGRITALGLQRISSRKCYCATFQTDGNVVYAGEGAGLDGEHVGEFSRDDLMRLHCLLHQSDMESLADSYRMDGDNIMMRGRCSWGGCSSSGAKSVGSSNPRR